MKKAFTLIELLVVISIISLLASVVLTSLGSTRIKARDTQRLQALKEIQKALELSNISNGGLYPDTGGTWGCVVGTCEGSELAPTLLEPYLSASNIQKMFIKANPKNIAYAAGEENTGGFWYNSSVDRKEYKFVISSFENLENIPTSLRESNFESCARFAASIASSDTARAWTGPDTIVCD